MNKSEYMDNFEFHFVAHQIDNLKPALELASSRHNKVAGWSKDNDWFIFYWHLHYNATALPDIVEATDLVDFIIALLRNNSPLEEEPDIDGSVSKGYEIKTCNHLDDYTYESFRIRPIWALHHK